MSCFENKSEKKEVSQVAEAVDAVCRAVGHRRKTPFRQFFFKDFTRDLM